MDGGLEKYFLLQFHDDDYSWLDVLLASGSGDWGAKHRMVVH